MAKLTIGGTTYQIRPFKLRELREAGDSIDKVNAYLRGLKDSSAGARGVSETVGLAHDLLSVFAVGVDGVTLDELEGEFAMGDYDGLWATWMAVQEEAGLIVRGEAEPAAAPAKPSRSRKPSDAS